ncbi:MAG: Gfo/Idh/MocA family oxidoreductase, partial [Clostridia bacterium]|nr:Gfo/Idh/MocA family oxidoreductase [Clostridia bacterium]
MGKIKIGVFGAYRGMTMIKQLFGRDDAVLVAVCDKFEPALDKCRKEAAAANYSEITYYTSFDAFIEHDMDAVVLANYANEHAPFAIRLMKSGRHVMTECLTMACMKEAVELIETVEQTGKVYAYAENYCYTPVRWEMRNLYSSGMLGDLMYAEGEYLHDCAPIWPSITYGERNHWRNLMSSTFYCTHSIGPILYMTGLRPVQVVALETPNSPEMRSLGTASGSFAMEAITLSNGAIMKSTHCNIKSYRHSQYMISGTLGGAIDLGGGKIGVYTEKPGESGKGERREYVPAPIIAGTENSGHGGGDYFTTHYFIRKILGDADAAERSIDVYTAVDMCMPGTLGYRSIVNGNAPIAIPNLRNKAERDAFRNDTFCTFPDIAGDMYVSNNIHD